MKGKVDFRTRKTAIVITIAAILLVIALIGSWLFIKGNTETRAASPSNMAGEEQQLASNQNEESSTSNTEITENIVDNNSEENNDESTTTQNTSNQVSNINNNEEIPTQNNTVTRIEREEVEVKRVLTGFRSSLMNVDSTALNLDANLPNLEKAITAIIDNEIDTAIGETVKYKIMVKNNGSETVDNINVSAVVPEGTELVEGSISDEGTLEDGKISWKVDVDGEKYVTFDVKVLIEQGTISATAIVEGKETNLVTINVVDRTKPTVLLNGVEGDKNYAEETIEADKTATYEDKGARVTDNVDPDTTIEKSTNINYIDAEGKVTAVNKVDMGVPGEYRLGYTYEDAAGNKAMARRIVYVVDTTKPTVLLNGVEGDKNYAEETIEADKTATYEDKGARVTDNVDHDTTIEKATNINYIDAEGKVTAVNKVDMGVPGEYRLGYTYEDAAGNKAMARRIVYVVDTTAPLITLNGPSEITLEAGIDVYEELGATVTDNVDETITNLQPKYVNYSVDGEFKEKLNAVDTTKPGLYKVVYEYEDAAGNTGVDANRADHPYVIRKVYVVDTTAPLITLNGPSEITLEAGIDVYEELGATVTDNVDETITNLQPKYVNYSVDGVYKETLKTVDVTKPGLYKVVYEHEDAAGNTGVDANRADHPYVIRKVYVVDTTAPLITLNGPSEITLEAGIDTYTELGATVTDNVDETITNLQPKYVNYSVDGEFKEKLNAVDTTKPGLYKVVYEHEDAAGNTGVDANRADHPYVIRKVNVVDTTAPLMTLNGESEITLEAGIDTYTELGATVTDNVDETITNLQPKYINYSVDGVYKGKVPFVDNTKLGLYKVVYEHEDAAGNTGVDANRADHPYVMRKVNVVDTTPPTAIVTTSNGNGKWSTNQDVTATLVASEPIKDIEGWVRVDAKTFTKVYSDNYKGTLEIEDIAGNKGKVKFEVKRIDKVGPKVTVVDPNKYRMEINTEYIEKGYSAYDEVDKDVTNRITIKYQFQAKGSGTWPFVDELDTSKLGTYKITYIATDKAGNEGKGTRVVEIVDTTKPLITLNGDANITIEENKEFIDPGVTIVDNSKEELTATLTVYYSLIGADGTWINAPENKVDTSVVGYYNIWYTATDSSGNSSSIRRTVKVIDVTPPTATVTTSNGNGKWSTNQDVTATLVASEPIKDIEGWVRVDAKTFTKVYSDNYKGTLEIEDIAGNKGKVKFEVKRIDKVGPKVTVVDPNKYQLERNTEYVDKGYSAYDEVDKDVTNRITIKYQFQAKGSGTWPFVDELDTSKLGIYKITYIATDKAGNEGKGTRVVEIVDTTPAELKVSKNITSLTKKSVTVTITANEEIKLPNSDWEYTDDTQTQIKKVYRANTEEIVTVKDFSDNEATATIKISNIDKKPPTATLSYSIETLTNKSVIVTLTASEEIILDKTAGTWLDKGNNVYQKVYHANTNPTQEIKFTDKAGNEGSATVKITNIDKTLPTATNVTITEDGGEANKFWVKIQFSEAIDKSTIPQGMLPVDGEENTYQKVYYGEKDREFKVKDLVGNEGTISFTTKK